MRQGDHVKVMGRDGFYVFLKEVQGTATLRAGGAKSPDKSILEIPIEARRLGTSRSSPLQLVLVQMMKSNSVDRFRNGQC
jgi:hypothetical protein